MTFNPAALPCEFPRKFVPAQTDPGDWAQLEPLFDELERRPIENKEALEQWLLDVSELISALQEEANVLYIRMTCQTDDPERERAYFHFAEQILPKLKQHNHRLNVCYVNSPARSSLPRDRYAVLDRKLENGVKLFREENVPLETQEIKLAQKYQKLSGGMTAHFEGREQTLRQMAKYLDNPDRTMRQKAWELIAERRLRERDALNEVYDELLQLREQIAHNAGFDDFRDYAFRRRERFDYTPADCFAYHEAVEQWIVPLARELQEARRRAMKLPVLHPWDRSVDPEGRAPLRPFKAASDLARGCAAIFEKIDPALATQFKMMIELGLLDLENRKGKTPGGYQMELTERRLPFIFHNAVGRDEDVRILLHEAGHAFHSMAVRYEPLIAYRRPRPLEFCEVAAMSMELLGAPYLEVFYSAEDAKRSRREQLESIVELLLWVATIDAFQHWVYTHLGHAHRQREDYWVELRWKFGGIESWEGHEPALRSLWHHQQHLFTSPFYYIEYGIAQLGALGLWEQARHDQPRRCKRIGEPLPWEGLNLCQSCLQQRGSRLTLAPRVSLVSHKC